MINDSSAKKNAGLYSYSTSFNSFYKNLNKFRLSNISDSRIEEIKLLAKMERIKFLTNPRIDISMAKKISRLMEKLTTCPKNYNIVEEEKYLFYMFALDPTFEAYIIAGTANTTDQIKRNMLAKFGLNDINLIKLERKYINLKMLEEKRKSIEDEIDKRVYR